MPARRVLRDYGNMSSATVMFVLKHILEAAPSADTDERICSMAFGPGLTVETSLMTLIPGPASGTAAESAAGSAAVPAPDAVR